MHSFTLVAMANIVTRFVFSVMHAILVKTHGLYVRLFIVKYELRLKKQLSIVCVMQNSTTRLQHSGR